MKIFGNGGNECGDEGIVMKVGNKVDDKGR